MSEPTKVSAHTSGPWRIEAHPDEKGVGLYADAWGFLGFLNSGTPDQANARRIVACVNACEGMTEGEIASGLFHAGESSPDNSERAKHARERITLLEGASRDLTTERDQLRERVAELEMALKGLLAACEAVDEGYYPIDAIEPARIALAKGRP